MDGRGPAPLGGGAYVGGGCIYCAKMVHDVKYTAKNVIIQTTHGAFAALATLHT